MPAGRQADYGLPLDSALGTTMLFMFARSNGFVLNEFHEKLAQKHGVSTDGVTISRPNL